MGNETSKTSKSHESNTKSFDVGSNTKHKDCQKILQMDMDQGRNNICSTVSAARSELYVTCTTLKKHEQKGFSDNVSNGSVLGTVLSNEFNTCYKKKNNVIQHGNRECGHQKFNQYGEFPETVDTWQELKEKMKNEDIAPTTSILTDDSIVNWPEDKPYPPIMPKFPTRTANGVDKDIYHAMTMVGYKTESDKYGNEKEYAVLRNQWGHSTRTVTVSVDDHPEIVDFARFPFKDENIDNPRKAKPRTLKITEDMKSIVKLELESKHTPAIGGDSIAGKGVIEAHGLGGDWIAERALHQK